MKSILEAVAKLRRIAQDLRATTPAEQPLITTVLLQEAARTAASACDMLAEELDHLMRLNRRPRP